MKLTDEHYEIFFDNILNMLSYKIRQITYYQYVKVESFMMFSSNIYGPSLKIMYTFENKKELKEIIISIEELLDKYFPSLYNVRIAKIEENKVFDFYLILNEIYENLKEFEVYNISDKITINDVLQHILPK